MTRLLRLIVNGVVTHCQAHKLALAGHDASDDVDYMRKKFVSGVNATFDWIDNSAVREAALRNMLVLLKIEGALELAKALDARWLSNEKAVRSLRSCLPAVIRVMEDKKADAGAGARKILATFKFVATLVLWCKVLPHIVRLSKLFQTSCVDFSIIEQNVDSVLETIQAEIDLADKEKKRLADKDSKDAKDLPKDSLIAEAEKEIKRLADAKVEVLDNDQQRSQFASNRLQWLTSLYNRIKQRFPERAIFTQFGKLLQPNKLPKDRKTAVLQNHGDAELSALMLAVNKPFEPKLSLKQQLSIAVPDTEEVKAQKAAKQKAKRLDKEKEKEAKRLEKEAKKASKKAAKAAEQDSKRKKKAPAKDMEGDLGKLLASSLNSNSTCCRDAT
jgi:hypothetical protein